MKFLWWAAVAAIAAVPVKPGFAQQTSPPVAVPVSPSDEHPGKVIFSRSAGEPATQAVAEPDRAVDSKAALPLIVSDAERQAVTFFTYDLDVHLRPREQAIAVRARLQMRNDSDKPLQRVPLQLSSGLRWSSIRSADGPVTFSQQLIKSDVDHTGSLREAVVTLAQPLAPQQTLALDVTYEGTGLMAADRFERMGTPVEAAEASDWDRVADDFVGLRGFGNVAWYPVASVPVVLGDGAKYSAAIALERQRQSHAVVSMRVTEEFFGEAPNLAVLDGQTFAVTPTSLPGAAGVPGIVTCSLPPTPVGFTAPSLFMLTRASQTGNGATVFARAENFANARTYIAAAALVTPLIHLWLGPTPHGDLSIVDLPEKGDALFEDGTVLFVNVHDAAPESLANILVHSLTHVYFRSPYPWLQEGVASFMTSLWLEQNHGRDFALEQLDNERGALSLAEPGVLLPEDAATSSAPAKVFSATSDRQALRNAQEPVFYRTKATYVFWMLRDLAGDSALQRALSSYQPGADTGGAEFEQVLERESGKDLKWFFEDWVNHDRGLPDLSIGGVYPNKAGLPGSYIVAVDVLNSGTAEAEVPVSVSSGTTTVTDRLRIPAKSRVSHRFLLQGQPTQVTVNDGTVPEVQASIHQQTLSTPANLDVQK